MSRIRFTRSFRWLGIVLAAAYWIVESVMDTYVYNLGPLLSRLFTPDFNETEMRSLAAGIIIAFGFFAQAMISRLERAELRLARMNECFLGFGANPLDNINRLTMFCGELLGAKAALYDRLEEGRLCSWGKWQLPPEHDPECSAEGSICRDIIGKGIDDTVVVRDLQQTPYARSIPEAAGCQPQTYAGQAVKLGDMHVGALCVVYQDDTPPSKEDQSLMGIIASAIGVEEVRMRAERALRSSEGQLRALSSDLLSAQETERKRLARHLHDSIGQSLSAIKFSIEETLEAVHEGRAGERVKALEATVTFIQGVVDEVRTMQKMLRPSMLDDLGIVATIGSFCREFQAIYEGISVQKDIQVTENEVPEPWKTTIYRILQEAMNNVAKHSKADLVRIGLRKSSDGSLDFSVEDNGSGFDPVMAHSLHGGSGVGLSSMRERTELSGGVFAVVSAPGSGTIIRALWSRTDGAV